MHRRRPGFSLTELVVVCALSVVLVALLLSAVQKARDLALRCQCQNQARQITYACLAFHDQHNALPRGYNSGTKVAQDPYAFQSWHAKILPFVEHDALSQAVVWAYQQDPDPFHNPPHVHYATPVRVFGCPSDLRSGHAQWDDLTKKYVALTSYLGVSGTDYAARDGVLFLDSDTRLAEVTDGTSNTLLLGERPAGPDNDYGWWYAGLGQLATGSADMVLGVQEQNVLGPPYGCLGGAYSFRPSGFTDRCGIFHFWSPHAGGANFGLCDGSVRFLMYSAVSVLPALATRAGGEVASAD